MSLPAPSVVNFARMFKSQVEIGFTITWRPENGTRKSNGDDLILSSLCDKMHESFRTCLGVEMCQNGDEWEIIQPRCIARLFELCHNTPGHMSSAD